MMLSYNTGDEAGILSDINQGGTSKERAINHLFGLHQGLIRHGRRKYFLTKIEAREVYLDSLMAFVKAVEKGAFKGKSKIVTYLYSIYDNRCKNKVRDRKRADSRASWVDEMPVLPDKARNMLQTMIAQEELDSLGELLAKLGGKCREILILYRYHGYNMEEIAQKLGFKSAQAVSTSKYRCMEKLKSLIIEQRNQS